MPLELLEQYLVRLQMTHGGQAYWHVDPTDPKRLLVACDKPVNDMAFYFADRFWPVRGESLRGPKRGDVELDGHGT